MEEIIKKRAIFLLIILAFFSGCAKRPVLSYSSYTGDFQVIPNKAKLSIVFENIHKNLNNDNDISSIRYSIENDLKKNLLNLTKDEDFEFSVTVNIQSLNYHRHPWHFLLGPYSIIGIYGIPLFKVIGEANVIMIFTDKNGKLINQYKSEKKINKWYNIYVANKYVIGGENCVVKESLRQAIEEIKYTVIRDKEQIVSLLEKSRIKTSEEISTTQTIPKIPQEILQLTPSVAQGLHWAVVIGVSHYKDSQVTPLRYSSNDAKAFYNWLIYPNGGKYSASQVKLLLDESATYQNIREALFVWLKQALEEDVVTFYFAGHGSPESPDSPNNLYFLTYDTQYDNIATTGFPMWDIETAIKRHIKAKKIVVLADACHSGGIGQPFDIARRADDRGIKKNPISAGFQNLSQIGDGVCVISASDEDQYSQEGQQWGGGHGIFTYSIIEGLNGQADYNNDSIVTLGELIPFLSQTVRRETRNAQSPTVSGKFDPALSIAR